VAGVKPRYDTSLLGVNAVDLPHFMQLSIMLDDKARPHTLLLKDVAPLRGPSATLNLHVTV
jgi:hypothetical protein